MSTDTRDGPGADPRGKKRLRRGAPLRPRRSGATPERGARQGGPAGSHTRAAMNACSLPKALETVGGRWSLLILRAAFSGVGSFEEFRSTLGIARNILADRLGRLVDHAILERSVCDDDRRRVAYRLTPKGAALLPTLVALRQWGDRWEAACPGASTLIDARHGLPLRDVVVRAADGRELGLDDLRWADLD